MNVAQTVVEVPMIGWFDWRAVQGTRLSPQTHNPYEQLARDMMLVCTPYWPCTDIVVGK
mgnify:FL=1